MLNFDKGAENTFIVTLAEKTQLIDPTYLFSFFHPQTKKTKNFILGDLSEFANHYNKFTFTEGSDEDHTLEIGQHNYTIYAQESTTNTDPELAEEVERGICQVRSESAEIPAFELSETHAQFLG